PAEHARLDTQLPVLTQHPRQAQGPHHAAVAQLPGLLVGAADAGEEHVRVDARPGAGGALPPTQVFHDTTSKSSPVIASTSADTISSATGGVTALPYNRTLSRLDVAVSL